MRLVRLAALLLLTSPAIAQAPATQPITGRVAEPVQVFNGKDLSGWVWFSNSDTKIEQVWSVKDGILRCEGDPSGYLRTEKEFGPDYILTIEYRHTSEGGGAFLFGINGADKLPPKAMQVLADFGNVGEVVNRGDYNWFVKMERYRERDRMVKIAPSSEKPLGEWNTLQIDVDHGELRVVVNGELQNSAGGMDDVTGKIGFLTGGAKMEFRKIQVAAIGKK